ncbi:universal stress protein [Hymenobacter sp. 15J16-1T3B]|uniref:universal stress protein n=1 Tax=Hymenobacter sp. 15J16-1T3B TaxID=2886941 RepID=UPI001D0FB7FB|nr:universal stress protein [Hymenobacter sp. 15J16-1T3B]MCC3159729.1 universal stress protein [Hymenobacter sp. 15J16-1T3B]
MNTPTTQPQPAPAATKQLPALTLLVLTSFFPESRRALRLAAELAQPLGARLVLVHVDQLALLNADVRGPEWPEQTAELREALQALADEQPVAADLAIVNDLLPDAVDELLTQYHPALFVLGRPAAAGADFDIGAAVLEILRNARVPLLLVPESYAGPAAPRRVAVAADDEPFSLDRGAEPARQLLRQLPPAQATVVTVVPMQVDESCAAALRHVRLSNLLPDAVPVTAEGFYAQHPADGLLPALAATQADWLLMLARRRSLLGELFHRSVTGRLLGLSPVPVLVVPADR